MRVGIDRHLDAGVAELVLHISERFSLGDEKCGESVAKIVEPNLAQFRFRQNLLTVPSLTDL